MVMAFFEGDIPAKDAFKAIIAESLVEAEKTTNEHFGNFPSKCGKEQYIWNPRYKLILSRLESTSCFATFMKKNRWDYLPIFDPEFSVLYIILNQNRFDVLIKRPEKDKKHYAKSPAIANRDLDQYDTICEQTCIWNTNENDEEVMNFRIEDLKRLEACLHVIVQRYVIITFKPHHTFGISSLSANLVDSDFNLKKVELWNEFIPIIQPNELVAVNLYSDIQNVLTIETPQRIDSKPEVKIVKFPITEENK